MTIVEAFTDLRREFGRRGWDRKATSRVVFELLAHVAIALVGIGIFMTFHNPTVRILGILISRRRRCSSRSRSSLARAFSLLGI